MNNHSSLVTDALNPHDSAASVTSLATWGAPGLPIVLKYLWMLRLVLQKQCNAAQGAPSTALSVCWTNTCRSWPVLSSFFPADVQNTWQVQIHALGNRCFCQIVLRNHHLTFACLKHPFPLGLLIFITPARGLRTFILVLLCWWR